MRKWLLYSLPLLAPDIIANPLPRSPNATTLTSPTNTSITSLDDPLDPQWRDSFTLTSCYTPPGPLWLLSDITWLSLSMASDLWRQPYGMTRSLDWLSPGMPTRIITWYANFPVRRELLSLIILTALSTIYAELQPDAIFAESRSYQVQLQSSVMRIQGALTYINNEGTRTSGSTRNLEDISNTKRGLEERQINNVSQNASLSAENPPVLLYIKSDPSPLKVSQLHFFQAVESALENWIMTFEHTTTLASSFTNPTDTTVIITCEQIKLSISIAVPQPTEVPATYGDLEFAIRQLVIAPELESTPRTFEATAHMLSRGGTGRAFVNIVLAASNEDQLGENSRNSEEGALMVLEVPDFSWRNATDSMEKAKSCPKKP